MTNDDDDLTDAERWALVELDVLDEVLDDHQHRLERIEHEDTCGFIWFADRPGWIDKRLG